MNSHKSRWSDHSLRSGSVHEHQIQPRSQQHVQEPFYCTCSHSPVEIEECVSVDVCNRLFKRRIMTENLLACVMWTYSLSALARMELRVSD